MAKRTINSKLYQSHQKAIQSLRKYKREANFMNKKMNELVDEIVEALEADSHVERKTAKEYKCDLVVEDFMNMFLKEMEAISRIPFDLIFYVYRVYCSNHDFFLMMKRNTSNTRCLNILKVDLSGIEFLKKARCE